MGLPADLLGEWIFIVLECTVGQGDEHAEFVLEGIVALDPFCFYHVDQGQLDDGVRHFLAFEVARLLGVVNYVEGQPGRFSLQILQDDWGEGQLDTA